MAKGRHHLAGGPDDPPPHARRRQPPRLPAGLCRYPGYPQAQGRSRSELNKSALFELNDVDVVAFLIDATKPIGRGDAWVAERVKNARSKKVLVLTKADEADPAQVMEQLKAPTSLWNMTTRS